jgi:hypothetical protein
MEFAIAVGVVYFIVRMRLLRRRPPPARPIEVILRVVIEPHPPPPREPPPPDPDPLLDAGLRITGELDRIVREARRDRVH